MNIRGGLFRLWIVFAVIFATAIFMFCGDALYNEFKQAYFVWKLKSDILMVPVDCKETRGKKPSADEFLSHYDPHKESPPESAKGSDADFIFGLDDSHCWYQLPKFRALYPEYKDLDDDTLDTQLYAKAGIEIKHYSPWKLLFQTLAFATGIPFLVLIFGRSLLWVIAGFTNKAQ